MKSLFLFLMLLVVSDSYANILTYAERGDLAGVQRCVQNGVNLDKKSKHDESTALAYATHNGHFEVIKYLVEKGANIKGGFSAFDYSLESILTIAAGQGHLEIVKYFIQKGVGINDNTYIREGDPEYIGTPYDDSGEYEFGDTPLATATRNSYYDIVKYLVENGANLDTKHLYNETTALIDASRVGSFDIVKLLVQNGANINIGEEDGYTALSEASRNGHLEIVEYLKSKGARE